MNEVSHAANHAAKLARRSLADNTRSSYRRALDYLEDWIGDDELDDSALAEYVGYIAASGRKPATAGVVLAAVKKRSRLLGQPNPVGPKTEMVMSGFRCESAGKKQAPGLTWDKLEDVVGVCDSTNTGLRDRAILMLMSDAMLRVSEVAAVDVGDVGHDTIHVARSKTDQAGEGAELYIGQPTVDAIRLWISRGEIASGPLFRPVYRDKVVNRRLSARQIMHVIKTRAAEAGYNASSHSLRVGTCQSLAECGASLVEMQQAGRWKDPKMPAYYSRRQMASRGAIAKYRYGGGP